MLGGHAEEHTWDAPIDDKGIKGNPNKTRLHGGGSSMSYAARYLKTNVFGVQTYRDDDGNAAGTGEGAEPITQEQFQTLNDEADKSGADKVRLAAWYKSAFGVDALAKLPARHFDRVKLMLENRAKKGGGNGCMRRNGYHSISIEKSRPMERTLWSTVRADIADEHKRQRDLLLEVARQIIAADADMPQALWLDLRIAIAECEGKQ